MNIEFGSGGKPTHKDYKQCDIRCLPNVDFCCHALDIKNFVNDNTVKKIFSRHFFEHMTFKDGRDLLIIWYEILKPGGSVRMILPNMSFHINQWLSRSDSKEFNWAKAGFWGWQRHPDDIHKSGYDVDSLKVLIESIGFKNFISLKDISDKDIDIVFDK
jgi:predicted SAM-dependent methyltransferase